MEQLRAKRAEAQQTRFLELPVPGYDDLLVVRYGKNLTWLQAKKAIEKAQRSKDQFAELWAGCDILIATVVGIYGKGPDDDEYQIISDKFDQQLSDFMDLGVSTAREVIRLLYGNDLTVGATQARVMQWLQSVDESSGQEISGNS